MWKQRLAEEQGCLEDARMWCQRAGSRTHLMEEGTEDSAVLVQGPLLEMSSWGLTERA